MTDLPLIRTVLRGFGVPFATLALAWVIPASAQNATLPEVAQALAVFDAECCKIQSQYAETQAAPPRLYTNQLATLRRKLQDAGDLEGILAVMRESERFSAAITGETDPFERVPEMPESTLVNTPTALRQLQDAYLKSRCDQTELRNKQLTDLTGRLIGRLDVITKGLTIGNRIADAVLVKKEADDWRKVIAENRVFGAIECRALKQAGRIPPAKSNPPAAPPGARAGASEEVP
jgi:hypothetical protein